MSLKYFHIFFIVISILLALGLGIWQFQTYQETRAALTLVWAVAAFISAQALIVYLLWFLKKMKSSK